MKQYLHSFKLAFKSLLTYKSSFLLLSIAQFFVMFTYYFTILALFNKFDNIKGFSVYEVLFTFAIIQFGFAMNETFARGIDHFDKLIIKGDFDRLLTRPSPILLQVLCSEFDIIRIIRVFQAIIILFISIFNLNINWNILKIVTVILMLISSIIIFFGVFLLSASYCFYTIQGLEVRNLFTDGGKHMAQYPIGIFKKGFVFIFTFIIPYAFVNYYPLLYVLGKSNKTMYAFSPLITIIYLIPCFIVFNKSQIKYTSVGS